MVLLGDLFDLSLLQRMLDEGYVRRQTHPELPLAILNYSELAQYSREWNQVTTQCRGLIYHTETQEVVARPFPKFFNHSEPGSPTIPLDAMVEVTDKLDGSLGVFHDDGDGGAIATRGSFTSPQAVYATALWKQRYRDVFTPQPGMTYLFEIIYPANRIVVDYKGTSDLFLLGAIEIESGSSFGPHESETFGEWPGPRATVFPHKTFADVLAAAPRPGAEGFVIRRVFSEDRLKLKQEDYCALHRIVTGCTARRLWEYLAVNACRSYGDTQFMVRRLCLAPDRISEILAVGDDWRDTFTSGVPEEFREWVDARVADLENAVRGRRLELESLFETLLGAAGFKLGETRTREASKVFAEITRDRAGENFNLIMTLWRGQEIESALWREARPEHELPYRVMDEAVA